MILGKQVIEQLQQVASNADVLAGLPRIEGETLMLLGEGKIQAEVYFADHDRYSLALRSLKVSLGEPCDGDLQGSLSNCAAAIVRHLSYLEEPLAVWELEGREGIAQLRSAPPLRDGDTVTYWDVQVQLGQQRSIEVRRCRWEPGMPEREVMLYPATFALVGRLVDSLSAALEELD
jgi:hypothetical protein